MTWSDIPGDDPTNAAMIKRDEPAAAPVAADEDPLAAVREAIDALVEFVSEDTLEADRSMAGVPDTVGYQRRYDAVLDEVRKLLAPKPDPFHGVKVVADPSIPDGLLVEHRPGDRWSVTP